MSIQSKILILFAHPAFEKSLIQRSLVDHIKDMSGVTFHDLYEHYPNFLIDVKKEQKLLLEHDWIVFQHPIYWYSTPALLKEWQDLVFQVGFAYGPGGDALRGKKLFSAVSSGGSEEAYSLTGRHQHTIEEVLLPFQLTAKVCGVSYFPPYVVYGAHQLKNTRNSQESANKISRCSQGYKRLLEAISQAKVDTDLWQKANHLDAQKALEISKGLPK